MIRPHKADILSGFFVFLIALPLCLGIAMASGFPPIGGIITAIIGGCVASFCGSAPLTIKGPAAGLIVIAIGSVQELGAGDLSLGYKRTLAVLVVAAVIQIFFAVRRYGSLADFMPPSVVHGMLAAIGVIIISKQMHILLGVNPAAKTPLTLLAEIPASLWRLNPEVFFVGGLSLLILALLPRMGSWGKRIPAPLAVILLAIPFSLYFDFDHAHQYQLLGHLYSVGPAYLVTLPGSILDGIAFPDFSAIMSGVSLKYILMFSLVGSIESLLTVSAVDAMQAKGGKSDLNADLLATGIGNLIAACLGGLPMISEIVRSKANIDNGARTHWANFSHGLFLLVFAALFPGLLHLIPLAVLSAMLVYTGFRLASPSTFVHTYKLGKDQLLLFGITLITTLATDLLVGVATGLVVKLILHKMRGAPLRDLFVAAANQRQEADKQVLTVQSPSVFSNYLSLRKCIDEALANHSGKLELDLGHSSIVDLTVQSKLKALQREVGVDRLVITGLERHRSLSHHHDATKLL